MQRAMFKWVRGYRVVFAGLCLVSIAIQFERIVIVFQRPSAHFFSFFTIQSNVFAAVVFLRSGLRPILSHKFQDWDRVRGAAVLYLAITGIVYAVLLSDLNHQLQVSIPWVDAVLHTVMPIVVVIDWLIDPPNENLTPGRSWVWLIYPIIWLIYTLIRGMITRWYPYPFVNPGQPGGYGVVLAYSAGITVMVIVLSLLIVTVGRRVRRLELLWLKNQSQ